MWGANSINVPLPFGNCPLFTEFLWGHPINATGTGSYDWSRTWPNSAQGQYYIQLGSTSQVNGQLEIRTPDCRLAICRL
jgi:hypothetical protein